jgi:hypothetical protein
MKKLEGMVSMSSYKLLSVDSNPKIAKSNKLSDEYWSCVLHMRPINTRICPYQIEAGCKEACLNTAGFGGIFPSIQEARQRKTDLFLNDREEFMSQLVLDIIKFINACNRKDKKPAIRLNGTSDIQWEKIIVEGGQTIFEMFPQVQFYDYTKIPTRNIDYIFNYHLTWSYSEASVKYAKHFDKVKHNIAVVFAQKLPKTFRGRKVIDGDKHDMRFMDKSNVVVGLLAKGPAKKEDNGFVIYKSGYAN